MPWLKGCQPGRHPLIMDLRDPPRLILSRRPAAHLLGVPEAATQPEEAAVTSITTAELCEIFRACVETTLFPAAVASRFERYEQALRRQTSPEEVNYLRLQYKAPVDKVVQSVLDAETEDEVAAILHQMNPPVAVLYKERLRDVEEFLRGLPGRMGLVRLEGSWSDTLRALLIGSYSRYLATMET